MIILRETALAAIDAGDAYYAGHTSAPAISDNGAWIITNTKHARTDHVAITDDEPLVGCLDCGTLVEPEPDNSCCGRHCPDCGMAL